MLYFTHCHHNGDFPYLSYYVRLPEGVLLTYPCSCSHRLKTHPTPSKAAWSSIEAWHHPLALSPAGSDPALGGENPRMLFWESCCCHCSSPQKNRNVKSYQKRLSIDASSFGGLLDWFIVGSEDPKSIGYQDDGNGAAPNHPSYQSRLVLKPVSWLGNPWS